MLPYEPPDKVKKTDDSTTVNATKALQSDATAQRKPDQKTGEPVKEREDKKPGSDAQKQVSPISLSLQPLPLWELYNRTGCLTEAERKAVAKELPRDGKEGDVRRPVFGENARKAYAKCAETINQITNAKLQQLLHHGISPPAGLEIKGVVDSVTGKPIGYELFLERFKKGEMSFGLPTYSNPLDSSKKLPGLTDIKQLMAAQDWIAQADKYLLGSNTATQVNLFKHRIDQLNQNGSLRDWYPSQDMNLAQQEAWLTKAGGWLDLTDKAKTYAKVIDDIDQATKAGVFSHWSLSRAGSPSFAKTLKLDKDFPGTIIRENDRITNILPDVPNNLERTQKNIAKMQKIEAWLDRVSGPVEQFMAEFALACKENGRLCLWGGKEEKGTTVDDKQYNHVQYKFEATRVEAKIVNPDGTVQTEPRIKVTTSRQPQWLGDIYYHGILGIGVTDVGPPLTSGHSTINGEQLEGNKTILLDGSGNVIGNGDRTQACAEMRLNQAGIFQVLALKDNSISMTQTDSDKKYNLIAANGWIDVLSGDKLEIGSKEVELKNDVRLYKPDAWVAVKDPGGIQMMQAKDLQRWATETKVWDWGGTAVAIGFDVAFIVTGGLEGLAARGAGKELLTKVTVLTAEEQVAQIARQAAIRSMKWHAFYHGALLGAGGLGHQYLENQGLHSINEARSFAMLADVAAGALPEKLKGLKGAWGSIIGKTDEAILADYLAAGKVAGDIKNPARIAAEVAQGKIPRLPEGSLTIGEKIKGFNDAMLKTLELPMLADVIYREGFLGLAQQVQELNENTRDATAKTRIAQERLEERSWLPPIEKIANNLVTLLDEKTRKLVEEKQNEVVGLKTEEVKRRMGADIEAHLGPETSKEEQEKRTREANNNAEKEIEQGRQKEAEKLAAGFSSSTTPGDRLASALALLRLRQREDGSLPDVLVTYRDNQGRVKTLELDEVQKFLGKYQPITFGKDIPLAKQFDDYTRALADNPSNRELLKDVRDTISLAEGDPKREAVVRRLVELYKNDKGSEPKLTAAIGLLFLGAEPNGAIRQKLGETSGWLIPVILDVGRGTATLTPEKVYGTDQALAQKEAVQNVKRIFPDGYAAATNPAEWKTFTETVMASQAIQYIKEQLGRTGSSDNLLAISDLLYKTGQMSPTELSGVCQEVLNNPNSTIAQQMAAMHDPGHERLAQLLPQQRELEQMVTNSRSKGSDWDRANKIKIMQDSIGRSSADLQKSLLAIVRDSSGKVDPSLKVTALCVLHIGNDQNPETRAVLNNALQVMHANPEAQNSFARDFVEGLKKKSCDHQDDQSSASLRTRRSEFLAALYLHELGETASIGLTKTDQKQVLGTLLDGIRSDRETKDTLTGYLTKQLGSESERIYQATREARSLAYQSFEILTANIEKLTEAQKTQLRVKAVGILNQPHDLKYKRTEPELKLFIIEHQETLFKDASSQELESLAQVLKFNANPVIPKPGGLAAYSSADVTKFEPEHLQLAQAAMKSLAKVDRKDQQVDTVDFLKTMATDATFGGNTYLKDSLEKAAYNRGQLYNSWDYLIQDLKKSPPASPTEGARKEFNAAIAELERRRDNNENYIQAIDTYVASAHPTLRGSAVEALSIAHPSELREICNTLARHESDWTVKRQLDDIERLERRKDPDSQEYKNEYNEAKRKLFASLETVRLTGAEETIASTFSSTLLANDFSNEQQHARLSKKDDGKDMVAQFETLINDARRNDEVGVKARNALAYIVLGNGRPFINEQRGKAVELAALGLYQTCKETNPEVKTQVAPLIELCLVDSPLMARHSRNLILNGFTWLKPGEDGSSVSREQAEAVISLALEREFKNTPSTLRDQDFKEAQDLQLTMLEILSRYKSSQSLPLLTAIADERVKSSLERDEDGFVRKVPYPDGKSSLEVKREDGEIVAFTRTDVSGIKETWTKAPVDIEPRDFDLYYSDKDPKKENPWFIKVRLENNGDFIITDWQDAKGRMPVNKSGQVDEDAFVLSPKNCKSPGQTIIGPYGSQTIFTRDGARIERVPLEKNAPSQRYWLHVKQPDGVEYERLWDNQFGRPPIAGLPSSYRTNPAPLDSINPSLPWVKLDPHFSNVFWEDVKIDPTSGVLQRRDWDGRNDRKKGVLYATELSTNGSVITWVDGRDGNKITRTAGNFATWADVQDGNECTKILETAGFNDRSDHPMPMVRELARQIVADLVENTEIVKQNLNLQPNSSPVELAARLQNVNADIKTDSEQLSRAIFEAVLSRRIEDASDPRRKILNELVHDPHERIRLAAAHMLLEQSNIAEDQRAGAIALADLSESASLLGYRQDAQNTIVSARKIVADSMLGWSIEATEHMMQDLKSKHLVTVDQLSAYEAQIKDDKERRDKAKEQYRTYMDDPIVRAAFQTTMYHKVANFKAELPFFGDIANSSDTRRQPCQSLLGDPKTPIAQVPESVRLHAAETLARSAFEEDRQLAATALAKLAKTASSINMRDQAWLFIHQIENESRNSPAANNIANSNKLIQDELKQTALVKLLEQPKSKQPMYTSGEPAFVERYESMKVDLLAGAQRPVTRITPEWFQQQVNEKGEHMYELLDAEAMSRWEKKYAEDAMSWWQKTLGKTPNYTAQYKELYPIMKQGFHQLAIDAAQTNKDGSDTQNSAEARAALVYIVLSNGQPLRSEAERTIMTTEAALAIHQMCKDKSPGADKMISLVATGLMTEPTLSPSVRSILFSALKEMVPESDYIGSAPPGTMTRAKAASIVVAALETTHQTMPPKNTWYFNASEQLQVDMIDYLKQLGYKRNMATLEVLANNSPSPLVMKHAKDALEADRQTQAVKKQKIDDGILLVPPLFH